MGRVKEQLLDESSPRWPTQGGTGSLGTEQSAVHIYQQAPDGSVAQVPHPNANSQTWGNIPPSPAQLCAQAQITHSEPPHKGTKHDSGKPDLSLIPLSALVEEAKGFQLGEAKYGRYNFTKGLESHRLVAAALRHILAWQEGEDLDPESGASHLGHARCCLAMLLETQKLGTLKDTRRTKIGGT